METISVGVAVGVLTALAMFCPVCLLNVLHRSESKRIAEGVSQEK